MVRRAPAASAVPLGTVNLYVGDEEGDRATAEAFYFGLLGLVAMLFPKARS
mgnify:CR=1 FL=1